MVDTAFDQDSAVDLGPIARAPRQATAQPFGDESVRASILKPQRNCWKVLPSRRASVLIDGATYFKHLSEALARARRSIIIIGWDFDGSICLRPECGQGSVTALGAQLRALVDTNPDLEIRILVWSMAVVHAPSAPLPQILGSAWEEHPRIQVRLDTKHPIYGAHHQKIVCIDDALAFVGGMDLTVKRWDTSGHVFADPLRRCADGSSYEPVHDIQMAVDGEAAAGVAEIAKERWRVGIGEEIGAVAAAHDPWPPDLAVDFRDAPIGIARTQPRWGGRPAVHEIATLTADALRAARHSIYIEAQYLTVSFVGDILVELLAKPDGPEVVVVTTYKSHGAVEHWAMGSNRDRLLRRLKRADRHGRLRAYYPLSSSEEGTCQVVVHSKLLIVDDVFLRVGSANLNNRSMGLDTECDLVIEGGTEAARETIVQLRNRLLAEHLCRDCEEVAAAAYATRSICRAVDGLNDTHRGLRAFDTLDLDGPTRPIFGTGLLDPKRPFRLLRLFGYITPRRRRIRYVKTVAAGL